MNQDHSSNQTTWPRHFEDDAMGVDAAENDFANFLDIDTDFSNLDSLEHGPSGLDTPMGRLGFGQFGMNTHDGLHIDMDMGQSASIPDGMISEANDQGPLMQNQSYHAQMQHQQIMSHQHYQVPLTPVSTEMHGAKYMQQVDQNGQPLYGRSQASFTPLVSPAQTPLDSAFRMPEYVATNEFFSPLSSPAIEAQHILGSNAESVSPADVSHEGSKKVPPAARRGRRKGSTSTRAPARSVKQSPAMKPQTRRRPQSVMSVPPEILAAMQPGVIANKGLKPGSGVSQNSDSSVSPEPLSDVLMPPPAMPRSSGRSPQASGSSRNEPATPATLMKMPSQISTSSQNTSTTLAGVDSAMEDIALPDSAVPPPLTVDTDAKAADEDQTTPTLSAKSAKISAASTPRTGAMTPQIFSPEDITQSKRSESRAGMRGSKKRQGTTSATISPALRPKISPSISPLVPAPGHAMPSLSAETSALYLASKSNYQNILEGTHLPGVSYPEALAENLSSKRTSHKIAEQGRRNRINTALKEIETLLPPSILATSKKERSGSNSNDPEESEKATSAAQSASKASTVEMAAVYIRRLLGELDETKEKLAAAETRLKDTSSSGSQASE